MLLLSIIVSDSCKPSSMGCAARSCADFVDGLKKRNSSRRFTIHPILRHHGALSTAELKILRGGSEDSIASAKAERFMIKNSEDFIDNVCMNAGNHGCNNPEGFSNFDGVNKSRDGLVYTTIGILDLSRKSPRSGIGYPRREDTILLSFIDNDSSIRHHDWWKSIDSDGCNFTSVKSMGDSETSRAGYDMKHAVNAQVMGALCDAIVLNFSSPREFLFGATLGSEHFDECLLCIAEGILRRLKTIDHISIREVDWELILVVTFNNNEGITDSEKNEAQKYLRQFLKCALSVLSRDRYGPGVVESIPRCNLNVIWTEKCATDAALDTSTILRSENKMAENLVPWPAFGTLATQLGSRISKHLALFNTRRTNEICQHAWVKMSPQFCYVTDVLGDIAKYQDKMDDDDASIGTTKQSPRFASDSFKLIVQDMVARVFASAEVSLLELENMMDRSFLEGIDVKAAIRDFRSDADAILDAISNSFSNLIDQASSVMKLDLDWANCEWC